MHLYLYRTLVGLTLLCALPAPAIAQLKPADKVVNYQKPTPEEAAAAIVDAQQFAKDVQGKVGVTFVEVQTDHFIVFTDWDVREHPFLKKNVEAAYTAVSRQFEMSPKDNIFIG